MLLPFRRRAISFTRALVFSVVGFPLALAAVALIVLTWQAIENSREAAEKDLRETLSLVTHRLHAINVAAELAAESVERIAHQHQVTGATLRPAMEHLVAALEQQPALSGLGLVLQRSGQYGYLERDANGKLHFWLFPGVQLPGGPPADPNTRNFLITDRGFVPDQVFPSKDFDPRQRSFYQAGLKARPAGTWMPIYEWIHHADAGSLWGFSYVKAVNDNTGALLGVLDADFDIVALNRLARALAAEYRAKIQIIELGTEPRLVVDAAITTEPLPLPPALVPLARMASDAAFDRRFDQNGDRTHWVATQRVALKGGVAWLVVVTRDIPLVEESLRSQLLQMLGAGLLIALGVVWLAIRIGRRFGRPLVELAEHVASEGPGEPSPPNPRAAPTTIHAFLETRRLGEALDRMFAERRRIEAELHSLAMHDELTGLPNRNLIRLHLEQAMARAHRNEGRLAVIYFDLDRFKVINDSYGHQFGDAVLLRVGARLTAAVRASDTVARLGGDEFLVLLPDLPHPDDAAIAAAKIVEALSHPIIVEGREIHLSASVGVSLFPEDGDTIERLIDHADMAMYRAKDLGRNNWQFFTRGMSQDIQCRVDMEIKLRGAIRSGQLRLVYQPKVCADSGVITGCEALLRWRHPELGEVPPAEFIPIAEDSGLIVPIGDWVLRAACAQARAWADAGCPPVRIAINLSARQFMQQDMVAKVAATLQATNAPFGCLGLELTESLMVQDVDKAIHAIAALRQLGVQVAIDDFGTGYSSLNYLMRFQVDALKIDQSFVRNMLTQKEDEAIVQAIIALAHQLKLKVIAEGVETAAQRDLLVRHGCDEIQGYLFSRPVAAEDFEALLRRGQINAVNTGSPAR